MNRLKQFIKMLPLIYPLYCAVMRRREDRRKYRCYIRPVKKARKKNIVFLVLTPVHGNLGDHAIALSETELIKAHGIEFYEIPGEQLFYLESHNKLSMLNGRPIFITGGGFLGTLWYHDERVVRNVILSAPDSPILIFPATVYYEDSEWGRDELEKAKRIYQNHRHLKLYAREEISLEQMKQFCGNVSLAPDMAMRMKFDEPQYERSGCLLCLRSDKEKTISDENRRIMEAQVRGLFENVECVDTVMPYMIPLERRTNELNGLFERFKKAELIITDRLHGMVIAVMTGTPCIVVNSKSPKVRGCYEWIRDQDYVAFCEDIHELKRIWQGMPRGGQTYCNSRLLPCYEELIRDMEEYGGTHERRK